MYNFKLLKVAETVKSKAHDMLSLVFNNQPLISFYSIHLNSLYVQRYGVVFALRTCTGTVTKPVTGNVIYRERLHSKSIPFNEVSLASRINSDDNLSPP